MKAPKMNVIPDKKIIKDTEMMDHKSGKREVDPRPEFSVNAEEFPAIKDWSVGKKYKMEIEVEMTGSRIGDWGDDKGKLTGSFKICGIMAEEEGEKEEDEMKKGGKVKEEKSSLSAYPEGMKKKIEKK
jgi:hypothetical protein